jgi:hypothetical protein
MLRELGVIPRDVSNPKVLALNKILKEKESVCIIKKSDVVVSTPSLLARAQLDVHSLLF